MFVPSLSWNVLEFKYKMAKRHSFSYLHPSPAGYGHCCPSTGVEEEVEAAAEEEEEGSGLLRFLNSSIVLLTMAGEPSPQPSLNALKLISEGYQKTHRSSLFWVPSLCLSRACLGKTIICSIKWYRKRCNFLPAP
jgi:hypothetical protein